MHNSYVQCYYWRIVKVYKRSLYVISHKNVNNYFNENHFIKSNMTTMKEKGDYLTRQRKVLDTHLYPHMA